MLREPPPLVTKPFSFYLVGESPLGANLFDFTTQIGLGVSLNSSTEKLNVKNMTRKAKKGSKRKRQKTGLNRNILDVGMGMLLSAIKYKVNEAGGFFLEAPSTKLKPSQRCSKWGHVQKKLLSQRVHFCSKCNYETDRDVNAAEVILSWALGNQRRQTWN
ncbi:MAG: transposase [Prochloraceae cyanobacterium]|nr:transposase [Prochloraceae cyanobacterium]